MQIMAHRGNKAAFPENSMAAFKSAVELGVDGIECDIHLTKDGQLVIIHDETINRTSNQFGVVAEMTLAELATARLYHVDGTLSQEGIPTLASLLDYLVSVAYHGVLNLELKTDQYEYPGIEAATLQLVEQYQQLPFEIVYSSFNWYSLMRLKQLQPHATIAVLVEQQLLAYLNRIPELEPQAVHLDINLYQPDIIRQLHGLPIRLWTVNQPADLQRFVKAQQQGDVSAIMTDYPAKALTMREGLDG